MTQYLLKLNETKLINIIEYSQNQPEIICLNIHGMGSHFQPIIPNPDELSWRNEYFKLSKYKIQTYGMEFSTNGESYNFKDPKCQILNFQNHCGI